ncbi:MAG: competence protein ComEA [bacterium]|nr:MAG: competence protein ComEA [bacterium]
MKKWFGGLLAGLLFSLSAWAAVDINTATQSELEAVKGIGPAKAKAIVEHCVVS